MSYDEVNDYELLSIVADNEDATEILFKKYRPLIVGIARKFYSSIKNNGCDFNDFVQEAMIAFSMAINTFDEKKDVSFLILATPISVFIGAVTSPTIIWNIIDILVAILAFINIYSLLKLKDEILVYHQKYDNL